jgi:multimeric flavodoxin WrbA
MNVTAILGSRNPEGQTARATNALLDAMTAKGWTADKVFLPELKIERCRQCNPNGWGLCRSDGRCVIEDDFGGVTERIRAADLAVFATPVYFSDLSESLRAYLDRLRRIGRHEAGKAGIEGKRAVGICVAGGGGGGAPACAVSLEKVLNTCGFNLLDMAPVRRQNLETKRQVLQITGEWLAEQGGA